MLSIGKILEATRLAPRSVTLRKSIRLSNHCGRRIDRLNHANSISQARITRSIVSSRRKRKALVSRMPGLSTISSLRYRAKMASLIIQMLYKISLVIILCRSHSIVPKESSTRSRCVVQSPITRRTKILSINLTITTTSTRVTSLSPTVRTHSSKANSYMP